MKSLNLDNLRFYKIKSQKTKSLIKHIKLNRTPKQMKRILNQARKNGLGALLPIPKNRISNIAGRK